ncbi:RNA-directed DNA polymerase, eukaryota [Tanacetum coccineum]
MVWTLDHIRNSIDDLFLPSGPETTRWVKFIPIKINVFTWRARRVCLPTRANLIRRDVFMESVNCPICGLHEENAHHIFFQCDLAQAVLRRICRWWDLDWQFWTSFSSWNLWFSSVRLTSNIKSLLEGVFSIAWWSIWVFRNRLLFDDKPPSQSTIHDDITSLSFHWCKNRDAMGSVEKDGVSWMKIVKNFCGSLLDRRRRRSLSVTMMTESFAEKLFKRKPHVVCDDEQLHFIAQGVNIRLMLIPAYRSFMGRFNQVLTPGRQTEKYIKYIKYQPEDIETCIEELLDGTTSQQSKKR